MGLMGPGYFKTLNISYSWKHMRLIILNTYHFKLILEDSYKKLKHTEMYKIQNYHSLSTTKAFMSATVKFSFIRIISCIHDLVSKN